MQEKIHRVEIKQAHNIRCGELMFCAHHGKEYAEKLATVAIKIQDETDCLVETK